MRALVWNNPFASLMLHGKVETRSAKTNVRGEVLICTAKVPYTLNVVHAICGDRQLGRLEQTLKARWEKTDRYRHDWTVAAGGEPTVGLNGYAIAVGNLVDCYEMTQEHEDETFVQYHDYVLRYCWRFEDVRRIEPFEWRFGKQGWAFVPDRELARIKYI